MTASSTTRTALVKEPAAAADQHAWVVVATQPGNFFGMTGKAVDVHRLTTTSAQDLKDEAERRADRGQRIATLGTNLTQWYATFTKGESLREDDVGDADQLVEICSGYEQLRAKWIQHSGERTVTQLSSLGNEMIAVFEPMRGGERCNLFWHEGKLTANTLHEPNNRSTMGLVTLTYFQPEDKWIMVFSDSAPTEEKWSVGPCLDRDFIQRGFDSSYCVRKILASPNQWFTLMQKTDDLQKAKQSILYSKSSPKDFEMKMWEKRYVMTCAAGNALPADE